MFANLHYLRPHQLVLDWILVPLLWLHELGESTHDVMWLPISQSSLILHTSVPEERGQSLEPLEPGRIGAAPEGVMACPYRGSTVRLGPYKTPLSFVSCSPLIGPSKRCVGLIAAPRANDAPNHLSRSAPPVHPHIDLPALMKTPEELPAPLRQTQSAETS